MESGIRSVIVAMYSFVLHSAPFGKQRPFQAAQLAIRHLADDFMPDSSRVHCPVADVTEEDYEAIFNLNVRGVLFCLKEAARCIEHGGRNINITSSTTIYPGAGQAVYAASKATVSPVQWLPTRLTNYSRRGRQTPPS